MEAQDATEDRQTSGNDKSQNPRKIVINVSKSGEDRLCGKSGEWDENSLPSHKY